MLHIIRSHATPQQIDEMLEALGIFIKLAVDIRRNIIAGGGAMHADCEAMLLEDGSQQEDIWGVDWNPTTQQIVFESVINIRPRHNNRWSEIRDLRTREQIVQVIEELLGSI